MNIAYRFRIYPNREQEVLLAKTFGCCRFLYNQMLNDKIREYEATKKMLRNTPAMYKKAYPFLKEVDSLALANVQMHLEKAYKNFFRNPKIGFPKFKSKHRSRKSYTTNVVNGNIQVEDHRIKLPKLKWIRMKKHRDIPEKYCLKSVTISMEPSGKYYASLLYEKSDCENQAEEFDYEDAKILGIDYAMHGMAVFSEDIQKENEGYFRKSEERLAREQRKLSHCVKGSNNYYRQKKHVALCHEKIRNQRKGVSMKDRILDLTSAEYRLLCLLVRNANRVITRDIILNELWDDTGNFVDDNTLSVYVRRLREKVEADPSHPEHLITVRGFGYQWKEVSV